MPKAKNHFSGTQDHPQQAMPYGQGSAAERVSGGDLHKFLCGAASEGDREISPFVKLI